MTVLPGKAVVETLKLVTVLGGSVTVENTVAPGEVTVLGGNVKVEIIVDPREVIVVVIVVGGSTTVEGGIVEVRIEVTGGSVEVSVIVLVNSSGGRVIVLKRVEVNRTVLVIN